MCAYKVLIIGNLNDNHMLRFVRNLKTANPAIEIYLLDEKREDKSSKIEEYSSFANGVFLIQLTRLFNAIPLVKSVEYILNWKKSVNTLLADKHFDVINIHYPSYHHRFILGDILRHSDKLVLTPWGSDVYRIGYLKKILVKRVYDKANVVTGDGCRFTHDFLRIFSIPIHKLRIADMGSESIDYISYHNNQISANEAKLRLGLGDSYVITCGYNAASAQRHKEIINSIDSIKNDLPSNLLLIFPVTYPKSEEYIQNLKNQVKNLGLNAVFFETYLDLPTLYLLRLSTDMFIHVQTTDANCASLREYLLCGKKVINGSWLCYDDLEIYGKPYFSVESIESLPQAILTAYHSDDIKIDERIISSIKEKGCLYQAKLFNNVFNEIIKY